MTSVYPTQTALGHAELADCFEFLTGVLLDRTTQPAPDPVFRIAGEPEIATMRAIGAPRAQGRPPLEVAAEMMEKIFPYQARMDHHRCFAFIPGPATPLAMLGELLVSGHNPHAGSWIQSSGPSYIEGELIRWMASQIGLPSATSGGLFVSGGSMANLTGLVIARDARLAPEERASAVVYTSDQTHSSNARGLRIIGFMDAQIRRVPSDDRFQMDAEELVRLVAADRAAGLRPFAVIASAGTTNTGSVDPLHAIADLCQAANLWMHVDGAYGASICLSPRHRHLLAGIERADSVAWDGHKWLFQTYGSSVILLRNRELLTRTFVARPEYLRDASTPGDAVNYWDLGPELTRPARALQLWFTLQVMGVDAMGQAISHGFQLAEWAQDELERTPHWEIASPAQLAIVNFRYAPPELASTSDGSALDALQRRISQSVMESGEAGVLTTQLKGRTVLRICTIHPQATEEEMRESIRILDRHARMLLVR